MDNREYYRACDRCLIEYLETMEVIVNDKPVILCYRCWVKHNTLNKRG